MKTAADLRSQIRQFIQEHDIRPRPKPQPACSVCNSAHLAAIEQALVDGATYDAIADKYGLSPSAIHRHLQNHGQAFEETKAKLAAAAAEPTPPFREWVQRQSHLRGISVPDLLALSPGHDPFYIGSPLEMERAEWFAALWKRHQYAAGTHLRRIHYRCVVADPPETWPDGRRYENTERDWKDLLDYSRFARWLGLVPADEFEDRRSPEPTYFAPCGPEEDSQPGFRFDYWDDRWTPWFLPTLNAALLPSSCRIPKPELFGYRSDSYRDTPAYLAVWIEKTTMDDILIPLCRNLGVDLFRGTGYATITTAVHSLKRAASIGKPVRVFYISDFDPQGENMPFSVARHIEFLRSEFAPGLEIALQPLAVTREQVEHYRLPPVPIKETNPGRRDFEARHGQGGVELDALQALHAGELGKLVSEAVARYRDQHLHKRLDAAEQRAEAKLAAAWQEESAPIEKAVFDLKRDVRTITAPYEAQLAAMNAELQAKLKPYRERMTKLERQARSLVEDFEVMLPVRPEPEVIMPDESDYLFDSRRNYFEQLAVYKERKKRQ